MSVLPQLGDKLALSFDQPHAFARAPLGLFGMRRVPAQRHPGQNGRSVSRFAVDAQFSAGKRHSLSHAGVAKAWSSLFPGGIESNAVVVYRKLESAIDKAKADFYCVGACMSGEFRSASCAMRNKQSATDRGGSSRFSSALKLVGIASTDEKRSHSIFSASISPRC